MGLHKYLLLPHIISDISSLIQQTLSFSLHFLLGTRNCPSR
ncbi:hypothetical protein BVRB_8g184630 [Beta vulgaris subsp. vulgaris]|nr:hypothetical protein BVRB_8g184630 [Beta vulgaris subsp. vulgaris]